MTRNNQPQNLNQDNQGLNQAQNIQRAGNVEQAGNKIIADLEQDIAQTEISKVISAIQKKATSYSERLNNLSEDLDDDPDALTANFAQRQNRCEESLFLLKEVADQSTIQERKLIQNLFQAFESMPEVSQTFMSYDENGALEITPDGESLLERMDKFILFREDAALFIGENQDLVSFDFNEEEFTEGHWQEITQAYVNANPDLQAPTLDAILDSFEVENQADRDQMKALLLQYEEDHDEIYGALKDAHAQFIDDINMLNQGEAYNRVLNQEKIKLSRKLGVRIESGNMFTVEDNNGNFNTYVIRGASFKTETPYFDKQRDLILDCEIIQSFSENPLIDENSDVRTLGSAEWDVHRSLQIDPSFLDPFNVYPVCESFAELEERLGFRSMEQKFTVGTLFSYRLDKTSPEKNYTEILSFDAEENLIFLSEPIPSLRLDGSEFISALKNKEADNRLESVDLGDGQTAYAYTIEEFLSFSYKYQAEEDVEAEINEKKQILTSEELNRRLQAHHQYMLDNNLAVSKKPIELHEGNILANLDGEKYKITSVSPNNITLENLSYPKFDGENPDPEAIMNFNLPELLKFIKDQNLGMITKAKLNKIKEDKDKRNYNFGFDWEWPETPFGLMSMNDIIDISKVFGEKFSASRQRKRDLKKAKFQGNFGQEKESLEQTNKQFDERVEFFKEQFKREGSSNVWSKELKSLGSVNLKTTDNRAKLKALIDLLSEDGSLSILDEDFINLINKARKNTRGVVTDPLKKRIKKNSDGEIIGEEWVDRDGTKDEDAVAEAINYIFNNNGQPSNFGTQCVSRNRSAFTSSMNEAKSKTDRLAKELKMNFDQEFGRLFNQLKEGKSMDSGYYTGVLQAMVDGGYQDLENFFYYLYAGLCHTVNGNGPILDDQFIESLNYGDHPFFHAFTAHKDILIGKKDEIWAGFSSGKNTIPNFKNNSGAKEGVQKFIWGYMLPLSTASTKKHAKTAEAKKYAKEYPGFVLSKLTNVEIENLFGVGVQTMGGVSFGGETNFNKHKDAFGQYATGFKHAIDFAENFPEQNDGSYIRNMLLSGIALFGITHGRYKTHDEGTQDKQASQRSFTIDQINDLRAKDGMQNFRSVLKKFAGQCGVNTSLLLDDSSAQYLDNVDASNQAEELISRIRSLSPEQLTTMLKSSV